MFFIFGSPRSGTTLLAQTLSSHKDIIIPHETDFIIPMAFIFDRIRDSHAGKEMIGTLITQSVAFRSSIGEYLSTSDVINIINACEYHPAAILNSLYAAVARGANAVMAGDKSPNDLLFLRMLIKGNGISSDMKIIHIVRDVRDVMVSLNRVGWGTDFDLYFPRFWSNSNLYLNALYKDKPSQYMFIRYEDMVSDPNEHFSRVCSFLGTSFQPEMLDPRNYHSRYSDMSHHTKLLVPISTANIGEYTKVLNPETLRGYECQAHEALEAFGYFEVG